MEGAASETDTGSNEGQAYQAGSGLRRVWLLDASLATVAVGLWFLLARHLSPPRAGMVHVPLLVLVGLFAITEVLVVHLKFRHDAHTFSLSEIPLMLGLFCAPVPTLLWAQVIGGGGALAFHRRQRPIKLAFNLSCYAISVLGAEVVFHAVLGGGDPLGPRGWAAGTLAALVASGLTVPAIYVAVTLSDGSPAAKEFLKPFGFAFFAAAVTSSIGLLAVDVLAHRPLAEILLVVPTVGLYVAHRAYVGEREKHHSLQFLYNSTRLLHHSERDTAVDAILQQARDALRADVAVLVYHPAESERLLRIGVGPGTDATGTVEVDPAMAAGLRETLSGPAPSYLFDSSRGDAVPACLAAGVPVRDGIVVELRGETDVIGALMVANRVSEVSGFQPADIRLLETLGGHLGIALQNGRLEQSLAQLRVLERQLTYQATHDSLTGLANRTLFSESLAHRMEGSHRAGDLAVLFVDLDDFKTVNDSLGHTAGDQLLVAVGERIGACLRDGDIAARLGGDEFAFLLSGVDGLDPVIGVAQRLLAALDQPVVVDGQNLIAHASIGLCLNEVGDDAHALMRKADTAMYVAKGRGKGCWAMFSPEMHEAALRRQDLIRDLVGAFDDQQLVVHFQPMISLAGEHVIAAEALIRWNHPTRGLLEPAMFISLAEETGLIGRLTQTVLHQACALAVDWPVDPTTGEPPAVSVNLSALDFDQPDLAQIILAAAGEAGLPPHRLIIEITETLMLKDAHVDNQILNDLAVAGVRIALDDFGTGYSSLSYLNKLPLNILKIAKPFVDDLGRDEARDAMAKGIVELGHILNLEIVAEGIERPDQVAILNRLGCDAVQGYLHSKPRPADDFCAWLHARFASTVDELLAAGRQADVSPTTAA